MIELTEEQKRTAVNMAMTIECGLFPMEKVLNLLKNEPFVMESIIWFWFGFNQMTRDVAVYVIHERARKHCETCFNLDAVDHPSY